jgi:hypothetical protein
MKGCCDLLLKKIFMELYTLFVLRVEKSGTRALSCGPKDIGRKHRFIIIRGVKSTLNIVNTVTDGSC